ncbi:GDSL-type esterase/lipase family protein [Actinoplanes missouriensis]|uniref:GDSL-type esterase/lipase family protein n=1 Tax=Actinoplanes missouriensis TaxID=1866 RepID=UPI0033F5EEDE
MRPKIGAVLAAGLLALFPAPARADPGAAGAVITVGHPVDGQTVPTGPLTVTGSVRADAVRADAVRAGPVGIRSVTVERDGRPPFPATVGDRGDFTAAVGTIGAGVHRIVVRAVLADGRTVEHEQWFTGRAGSRYVALGDSWTAGAGLTPYRDRGCRRPAKGWPARVKAPGRVTLTVEACAGWTGTPDRLRRLGADTDLVTVTFGGDDVGLTELAAFCATRTACATRPFVGRDVSLDTWTRARIGLLRAKLDDLYRQIRARVRPDTTIVAVTYPHLPACATRPGITRGERRWLNDRIDDLDELIIERAATSGLVVADVRGGCGAFHPDQKGAIRYAETVSRAIRTGTPAAGAAGAAGTPAAPATSAAPPAGTAPARLSGRSAGAAPARSAGALPRTGMPGWALPATGAGIALILLGAALIRVTHRD